MDLGKENDAVQFQHLMSSDITSRIQGVKNSHKNANKDLEGIKRKPFGSVNSQSVIGFSKTDAKGKQQKVDFKKGSEFQKPPGLPKLSSTIAKQPISILPNTVTLHADVRPDEVEYDEIEFMDRPKELEDDFCDLCPVVDQPATYVKDLLHWYPCMWSGGKQALSPASERSMSPIFLPDWKRNISWLDEVVAEPQMPDLPLLPDDWHDEL